MHNATKFNSIMHTFDVYKMWMLNKAKNCHLETKEETK